MHLGGPWAAGDGSPVRYSCLENPMGRGAWRAAVHGSQRVGQTERLHFHFRGQHRPLFLRVSCLLGQFFIPVLSSPPFFLSFALPSPLPAVTYLFNETTCKRGLPSGSAWKEPICSAGDAGGVGSVSGSGRSPAWGMATRCSVLTESQGQRGLVGTDRVLQRAGRD